MRGRGKILDPPSEAPWSVDAKNAIKNSCVGGRFAPLSPTFLLRALKFFLHRNFFFGFGGSPSDSHLIQKKKISMKKKLKRARRKVRAGGEGFGC